MNGYTVALFLITTMTGIALILCRFVWYERLRLVTQKYPLFAVRDEFVRLKIQGAFEKDPGLYDLFCDICNALIVKTRDIDFMYFLSSVEQIESNVDSEELRRRMNAAPESVRKANDHLWGAIAKILVQNSTLLRLVLWIHIKPLDFVKKAPDTIRQMWVTKPVARYADIQRFRIPA